MKTATKSARRKPAITAEDLLRIKVVSSPAMSPDERRVAYVVERMDKEDNKYYSNIHVLQIATGESIQFTHGKHNDGQPAWSPDGRMLAFVSTRDKKTGIYLIPTAGGAERRVLEIEGSPADLQWAPDNRHLVFSLQYSDSHFIKDEKKKKAAPVYRHITRFLFQLDGVGYLPTTPQQVFTLDTQSEKLTQVTRGKRHNGMPCVSPDGRLIAYVSNRSRDEDLDSLRIDLFVIPFGGGRERRISTPPGPVWGPRFSPDGRKIAYLGHDNPDEPGGVTPLHVWTVGVNGKPAAKDLIPRFDRMAVDECISDTEDAHGTALVRWSGDGKRVFFLSSDTGVCNLFSVPASGGKPTRLFKGKCRIKQFAVAGTGRTAAVVYSDLNTPGDIMTCPTVWEAEKKAKRHTHVNRFLQTELQLGRTREVWFKSYDGTDIQGWLVTPPDFRPGKRYPAILEIHGGPRVQYAFAFFHEMQYLAAGGYVVLYTNPRGGAGRGETWAGCTVGAWGELDGGDCMAAADWLEKQPFVDSKRIGVTGGSYGGFMTNWLIGHTNRFRAAVTQRSVTDLTAMFGSSDFGFSLEREFNGWPWEIPEVYERCSPITYFKNVRTPVLILHNENDLRCDIEQANRMFFMLKALGKKVEMVRFPEEPHGLSRHGRPDRRLARLDWIRKWFDRYMKR